jgi:uncharacterized membrane protein
MSNIGLALVAIIVGAVLAYAFSGVVNLIAFIAIAVGVVAILVPLVESIVGRRVRR